MFEANNQSELIAILAKKDISVPKRTEGRTKEHTETYAIAYLLSTLACTDLLNYPICLTHRDRPDFLLSCGERKIGIEHAEVVAQNEAHKTVLREKGNGSDVYFIAHAQPGESKKKAKELIEEIKANNGSEGWDGDSVEREWAAAMFHFVKQKEHGIRKEGFDRFGEDWLLMYDNWSLPALRIEAAVRSFFDLYKNKQSAKEFVRIFVISSDYLCEISLDKGQFYKVNNLWK